MCETGMNLCNQELESQKNALKILWELKREGNLEKIREITKDCSSKIGLGVNCLNECPIEVPCYYHEVREMEKDKERRKSAGAK
jgi:hypothetical protein